MTDARFEHFDHGADIGVVGIGPTMDEAFAEAARGLTAVVVDPAKVEPRRAVEIACAAPDDETLLYDWLNAVVYEMATRGMLFARFDVRIEVHRLAATARGEPVDPARHAPAVEVKGATWTGLSVRRGADGLWRARCVVDV